MKRLALMVSCLVAAPVFAAVTQHGPVTVEVDVDRKTAQVAEPITLIATLTADPGVAILLPPLEETWGGLDVIDVEDVADLPMGDKRQWRRTVVLESLVSGEIEVPGLTAAYTDRRFANDPVDGEIATEPIALTITSVLEGDADPTQFRDIKGKVEPPTQEAIGWLWPTVISTAAAGLLVVGGLALRRRGAAALRPDQRALRAIQELLDEQPEVHAFYLRLTGIVRDYIEQRFAIRAPRLTTPEFLEHAKASAMLTDEDKRSLHTFLTAADMVKFARYEPSSARNDEAVTTARAFIERTAAQQPKGAAA